MSRALFCPPMSLGPPPQDSGPGVASGAFLLPCLTHCAILLAYWNLEVSLQERHNHIQHPKQPGKALCELSTCTCCWGRFRAVVEDIKCLDCLQTVLRDGYNWAMLADEQGYLTGVTEPR